MLRLRPYHTDDARDIITWLKDEHSLRQWSADQLPAYPPTAADLNAYYHERNSNDFWEMTAFDEQGIVGQLLMRFVDKEKQVLRFGFIIIAPDRRGCGYGRQMLLLAQKYAFEILQVSKITLGVFENNPSARHCYETAGFQADPDIEITAVPIFGESWKLIEMVCTP